MPSCYILAESTTTVLYNYKVPDVITCNGVVIGLGLNDFHYRSVRATAITTVLHNRRTRQSPVEAAMPRPFPSFTDAQSSPPVLYGIHQLSNNLHLPLIEMLIVTAKTHLARVFPPLPAVCPPSRHRRDLDTGEWYISQGNIVPLDTPSNVEQNTAHNNPQDQTPGPVPPNQPNYVPDQS